MKNTWLDGALEEKFSTHAWLVLSCAAIIAIAWYAARDVVLLNAAAALTVADRCGDLAGGLELAERSIDSGAAIAALERLVAVSHGG